LILTIRNAENELELIVANSEPSEKRSPQKCSNCGGEGRAARTCTKGGSTHVRRDTLPPTTTLQIERGRGNSGVPGPAGAHQVIVERRIRENPGVNAGVFVIAHRLGSLSRVNAGFIFSPSSVR
jgi:hypothetical protein